MITSKLPEKFAIISGDNPLIGAQISNPSTIRMQIELAKAGYSSHLVIGKYKGQMEQSLLVPGLSYDKALGLALKYGQESFITADNRQEIWLTFTKSEQSIKAKGILPATLTDENYTNIPALGLCFSIEF